MLLPQHSRLLSRIAIPALLIAVVVAACGGSSERTIDIDPATGITQKGDALSLTIYVVDIEDDVYYKDTNGNIYVKRPSIPGNKIAAIFAQIRNHGATNVFIDVGHNSLELRDDSQGEYPPIDPFGDLELAPNVPADREPLDTMWGSYELPNTFAIRAWSFFEIPGDILPTQLRWSNVNTIFVRWTPFEQQPPRS
jgi:hypothetical protein